MKHWQRRISDHTRWVDPGTSTEAIFFKLNNAGVCCRVSFSLGNDGIWLCQSLMCLPEGLKILHIGIHKRFYFPLPEIPEQQHNACDENNEEEKTFHGLGV